MEYFYYFILRSENLVIGLAATEEKHIRLSIPPDEPKGEHCILWTMPTILS